MESENPFKNVEIVSGNELENYNPNELIYLDDEDDSHNRMITSIQIELCDNQNITNNHEEEDHPLHVKVEPEVESSDEEMPEILRTAVEQADDCLTFVSLPNIEHSHSQHELDSDNDEEQFQIIEQKPAALTPPINNIHDHSYSQSQNPIESTFCDDIVENILKEANTKGETNSVKLLSSFTTFMKNYVITDDEQNSQVAQYLSQMSVALDKLQTTPPKCDKMDVDDNSPPMIIPDLKEDNGEQQPPEIKQEALSMEFSTIEIDETLIVKPERVSLECVKITTLQTNGDDKDEEKDENLNPNVRKLKVYAERVQNSNKKSLETCQKLLEAAFVSQEDVDNGTKKIVDSLNDLTTEFDKILIEMGYKREVSDLEKTEKDLLQSEIAEKKKKSSTSDESEDEAKPPEVDDEIDKLCDFSSLNKQKSNSKIPNGVEKPVKVEKEKKKKLKEDEEDLESDLSDSDMDSLSANASDNEQNFAKSDHSENSDEEEKMREKLENKAKADLLKDSDEGESDEASYHTSASSSLFSSDDDEKASKKEKSQDAAKTEKKVSDAEEEEPKSDHETPNEPQSKVKVQNVDKSEETSSSDNKEEKTESNTQQKKPKKKLHRSSYEKEIFNKKFLEDSDDTDDDDKERVKRSPKFKKNEETVDSSIQNDSKKMDTSMEVLDLSAFDTKTETRTADQLLGKYFERLTQSQQEPCDLSKAKEPIESPKKNSSTEPSTSKQTVPSPSSIDDITCISLSSESDSEISSTNAEGQVGRRRKQLTEEELKEETKKAKKDENERIKKLEEKSSRLTQFLTQRLSQSDLVEADELILDFSEDKDIEIKVHPRLVHYLKPHQVDGVKFMYNNCYGSIDEVKANNGSGCILAHCMGLGKTLQLITLLHTVMRYDELHTKRILVICPKSTILNWSDEFKKWLRGIECERGKKLVVKYMEDNLKIEQKIKSLEEWFECEFPSVFLINYESFRILVNWSGTNKRNKIPLSEDIVKKYQARIAKCLLDPGPNLVVCDEGHMIKNQKGATNGAVTKVKTKRRIILTGTPVQNALQEYYAMVQWIKPNLLGTAHEFNNIYANPIKDGQNKDSTASQIKKMKQKSYVLNKNLSKFVQRKDAGVLKEFLPVKHEYCISVPLTEVQEKLYNYYLEMNRNEQMGRYLLPHYTALRKIWTHPKVLQHAYERALKGETKQAYQLMMQQRNKISKNAFNEDGELEAPDDVYDTSQGLTSVENNWWSGMITRDDIESLHASHKMRLLFEILSLSEKNGEKILIFSSFVAVLDCIEQFMRAIHNQRMNPNASRFGYDRYHSKWELGKDYYRLDGSTPKATRQHMINEFNRPGSSPRCFLISAKAGGQGINLTAANRCIIVDTSWNPANDNQNIFRIYRLGQTKTCYVYRFVAASTMEDRVYSRSVTKEAMSHRVVEKKQVERHYVRDELNELFVSYKLKPRDGTLNFPKDEVLRALLFNLPNSTYNFHEHDSLLENKPEDDLDEEEKKEAWQFYITESTHANRMNTGLQNNMNNMQPNQFAKASELLKYYPDMNQLYNSAWLNPLGLPTTGLDATGLNSSFFPMSSSLFASDLFKRIGSYDPLNLYSSPSLNSPPTTASTSSLMSSLLHPHNPISALGNLTTTAATSSYNANNIPPATNSMFALPSTSSATTSTAVLPQTSSLQSSHKVMKMKNGNNNVKQRVHVNVGKKPHQIVNQFTTPKTNAATSINDTLIVPQNSSQNLLILPDADISPSRYSGVVQRQPSNSSLVITSPRTLNEGTSARTNFIATKKTINAISPSTSKPTSVIVNKNNNNNFRKPPTVTKVKNAIALQKKMDAIQNGLKYPQVSQKQLPNVQNRQRVSFSATRINPQQQTREIVIPQQKKSTSPQQVSLLQKSPQSSQQLSLQRNPSQLSLQKTQIAAKPNYTITAAKQNRPVVAVMKQINQPVQVQQQKQVKTMTVNATPSKDILRQLEKNQTSLIDTSKKLTAQSSQQNLNLSPGNSVSIIKLNKTTSSPSSLMRSTSSQNFGVVIPSSPKNVTIPRNKPAAAAIRTMSMSQAVQQAAPKRKNDSQNVGNNSQELKKARLTQSQSQLVLPKDGPVVELD